MGQVEQRLVFVISAKDESVAKVMRAVQKAIKDTAEETESTAVKMKSAFANLGKNINSASSLITKSVFNLKTGVAALVGAAGLGRAAKEAIAFQEGLAEIGTVLDDPVSQLPILKQKIRDVALEFGLFRPDAVKAQYDIVSSGFTDAAKASQVLETSARLAVAGVADVGKTADVLTTVLNGFRLSAEDAEHVGDTLFLTVERGKVTVSQLAQHFGILVPNAEAAGIKLEEVGAAIAAMTAAGVGIDKASTSLRQLFANLAAPTGVFKDNLEAAGIQLTRIGTDGREVMLPLIDVIKQFRGLDLPTLRTFIPDIDAVTALTSLTNNFENFADFYKEFTSGVRAGALGEAFAIQADTAGFRIKQLTEQVRDSFTVLGEGFVGELGAGADDFRAKLETLSKTAEDMGKTIGRVVSASIDFFAKWHEEIIALIAAYGTLRAAVATVTIVQSIGQVASAAKAAATATVSWATGLRAALGVASGGPAVLAALAAAVVLLGGAYTGLKIGERLNGVAAMREELAHLTVTTKAAATEFETSFVEAVGKTTEEIQGLVRNGVVVLQQQTELFNRGTGELITTAEQLAEANKGLGVGTRLLSAEVFNVAEASSAAAAAFVDGNNAAAESTAQSQKLSNALGIQESTWLRLPEAIRNRGTEIQKDLEGEQQAVKDLTEQFNGLQRLIDAGRDAGIGVDQFIDEADEVKQKLEGVLATVGELTTERQGFAKELVRGEEEGANAARLREEAEADAERQRKLREENARKERAAKFKQELKAIQKARDEELKKYTENEHLKTEFLADEIADRLHEVRAFAGDEQARLAGFRVAVNVVAEIDAEGKKSIKETVDKLLDEAQTIASDAGTEIGDSLSDGITFKEVAPRFYTAVDDVIARIKKMRAEAAVELESSQKDLDVLVANFADAVIRSGTATEEEVSRVLSDPLNSSAWITSGEVSKEAIADVEARLGALAEAAKRSSAASDDLQSEFDKLQAAANRTAGGALRELIGGLGDLTVEQLKSIRSGLYASDAMQASAISLIDAKIAAAAATAALKDFDTALKRLAAGKTDLAEVVTQFAAIPKSTEESKKAAEELSSALSEIGSNAEETGLFGLISLRREIKEAEEDLSSLGFKDQSDAAAGVGKLIGDEIQDRVLQAAKDFATTVTKAVASAVSSLVAAAKDAISGALSLAGQAAASAADTAEAEKSSDITSSTTVSTLSGEEDFLRDLFEGFAESIQSAASNLDSVFEQFVKSIPSILGSIADSIPEIVQAIADNFDDIVQAIVGSIDDVARSLAENAGAIAQTIADAAVSLAEALPEIAKALADAIADVIVALADKLPEIVDSLVDAALAIVDAIADVIPRVVEALYSALPGIVAALVRLVVEGVPKIVTAVVESLPMIIQGVTAAFAELVKGLGTLLAEAIPKIIDAVLSNLDEIVVALVAGAIDIVEAIVVDFIPRIPEIVVNLIESILTNIPQLVVGLVTGIVEQIPEIVTALITGVIESFPEMLAEIMVRLPIIVAAFVVEFMLRIPEIVLELMGQIASSVVSFFSHPFQTLGKVFSKEIWGSAFGGAIDKLKGVFDGVKDAWSDLGESWSKFWDGCKDFFSGIVDFIEKALSAVSLGLSTTGNDKEDRKGLGKVTGAVGDFVKGIFQFGGVAKAQFGTTAGDMISGLGNKMVPILAHAGEGILKKQAVQAIGGVNGVRALNAGTVPSELMRRASSFQGTRGSGDTGAKVSFTGATVFGRDASSVVDEITYGSYSRGRGRTSRFLGRRFGGMPGQRT